MKKSEKVINLTNIIGEMGAFGVASGGIAVGLTAIITAVTLYRQHMENLRQEALSGANDFEQAQNTLESYAEQVESLRASLESGTLTEQEAYDAKKELYDIQGKLNATYGDAAEGIDLVNGSLDEQISKMKELALLDAQSFLNKDASGINKAIHEMTKTLGGDGSWITKAGEYIGSFYDNTNDDSERLKEILQKYSNIETDDMGDGSVRIRFVGDATQAKSVLNDLMSDLRAANAEFGDSTTLFQDIFDGTSIVYNEADKIIQDYQQIYQKAMQARLIEEQYSSSKRTYGQGDAQQTAADWLNDYTSAIEAYNNALSSGDTSAISEARDEFENLDAVIQSLLSDSNGLGFFAPMFNEVRTALNESAIAAQNFRETMNHSQEADYLQRTGMTQTQFAAAFVDGLGSDTTSRAVKGILESYANQYGIEFASMTTEQVESVAGFLADMGVLVRDTVSGSVAETLHDAKQAVKDTTAAISGITSVQKILASQGAGNSLSVEDYTSDAIKDYTSALEYVNGVYQLNVDKVNAIVEAKSAEQIAVNDTSKAYAQMKYFENAKKIDKLNKSLAEAKKELNGDTDAIQANIDALRKENISLLSECQQYDMLSVSLRNAASAYQHWMNSRNSSDYGDLFDSTMLAVDEINNTFESGNFGSVHYKAALDLVVPEDVDKEDIEQVRAYVDKLSRYLSSENGKVTGLNMTNFLQDAKAAGLMGYDAPSDYWSITPGVKLEDFARELGLAEGMVSAFFDELTLKGGEFSFGDELSKSFGDLAAEAEAASEELKKIFGEKYQMSIDVSDIPETEDKLAYLNKTISDMQELIAAKDEINLDASQVEYARSIIEAAVEEKRLLFAPDIMMVDTSVVQGELGRAIEVLQEFQRARDNLDRAKSLGLDTAEAQANLDAAARAVQELDANLTSEKALNIDTSSIDSISSSLKALTADLIVKAGVDESAVIGYQQTEHSAEGTVTWDNDTRAVDIYAAAKKYASGAVAWYNDISLVRTHFTATGSISWSGSGSSGDGEVNGSANAIGTAHAYGTARANGDWGTAPGGRTLVGELGQEIVVDTRTGKWYTVGDNGAEFRNIPAGAIVFNHKQTESLFENGYAVGRARALATGTAMVGGGISGGYVNYKPSPSSGYSNPSGGASSSVEENYNSELETFDWIEIAINRIERVITRLGTVASSVFKSLRTRMESTSDEIAMVSREIGLQQQAYEKYRSAAEAVELSYDLKQLVQNGAIDISQYDQDTQKLINDYKDLYEKALDCAESIDTLHENLAQLYKDNFDNVQKNYENQLSLMEKEAAAYSRKIDMLEAQGYMQNASYYQQLQNAEQSKITTLTRELSSLQNSFAQAMASGEIEEGSEAWYEMKFAIEDVRAAIEEAEIAVVNYDNTMRQISWDYFDTAQERVSQITSEADFLLSLLDGSDMFDENGNLNDNGTAAAGLRAEKYGIYMAQADKYADEIKRINAELANDPNNTTLLKRRNELVSSQREAILAAKSEKEAMVELAKEGISAELEALKSLTDAYTESLDSAKDLYEYQKKIADKTKNIADIEKQLAAYQENSSEETRAKLQKLQVQLQTTQDDLKETEYDKFVSDSKQMLDSLYSEYETVLNERFDDVEATFEAMLDLTNDNFISINEYLSEIAGAVGYTISDDTNSVWSLGGGVNGFVSAYGEEVTSKLTATGLAVENIFGVLEAIARANGVSFTTAKSYASGGLIDYTGVANVHGSSSNPELVLNAEDTKNFIMLRNALRSMSNGSLSGLGIMRLGDYAAGAMDNPGRFAGLGSSDNGHSVGEITVNIPIERVEDYNDFVNQLKNDKQFEQMVQEVTVGRLAGKSSLSKNKFKW